jgi:rubrerythrin
MAAMDEPIAPDAFQTYDEEIETEYCCPKCGYEWSGKPK